RKNIPGFMEPENQDIEVTDGSDLTVTGTYVPPNFTLTTNIEPPEAVAAGAQWRVESGPDTSFKNSGDSITLPAGTYNVMFSDVFGLITPNTQTITENLGNPVNAIGTYDPIPIHLGITDVSWSRSGRFASGGLLYVNGIPVMSTYFFHSFSGGTPTPDFLKSEVSFRLYSEFTPYQIVSIEVWSVVSDTTIEDTLLRTLTADEPVVLEDNMDGTYSKYFENFVAWDGLDDNGEVVPPGFYKVKVYTDEDTNWDEEYELTSEFKVIPRKFLRSPFVNPSDSFPIGTDLVDGIMAGLYPTYYELSTGVPVNNNCEMTHRFAGQDPIEHYTQAFQMLGISDPDITTIIAELQADGTLTSYNLTNGFPNVNLTPPLDVYNSQVSQVLVNGYDVYAETYSWQGHCADSVGGGYSLPPDGFGFSLFPNHYAYGGPVYEGPVSHGVLSDGYTYFDNNLGQICRCGDTNNLPECDAAPENECSFLCTFFPPGEICGIVGNIGEHWEEGNIPVREDLVGYLHTPISGPYEFRLIADDMGLLTLGGSLTLNSFDPAVSGGTTYGPADSTNSNMIDIAVDLEAGYHPIEINFENQSGNATLQLLWNLRSANNQNFIFTDPTFIQEGGEDLEALDALLNP
ncbi:MAG: hypothetical protein K8I00_00950, partial [Candidatus Omnitrophica bacterium]|nr:hypothetical protein [Candidatus Omnitrophota bacterium]